MPTATQGLVGVAAVCIGRSIPPRHKSTPRSAWDGIDVTQWEEITQDDLYNTNIDLLLLQQQNTTFFVFVCGGHGGGDDGDDDDDDDDSGGDDDDDDDDDDGDDDDL
ncbi:hypothetical protein ElyMa_003843400 [Elysia marginata]|uniref:Uncharacterized protein n=1 Tax=Elysia marginata TaxID=1093978 RepID=A0AAV4FHH5_9GAST|nr:hypothetical protein ElyMa_003843400 [Elysia marginata]